MQDNSNGAKTSSYGGMSYGGASGEGTSYGGYSGGYGGGATQDYGSAGAPPGGGALEQYSGYSGYTGYGGMPPPAEDYGYGTPAVSVPARPATPQLANPSPDGRLLPETNPSASRLTVSDAVWLWRLRSSRFPPRRAAPMPTATTRLPRRPGEAQTRTVTARTRPLFRSQSRRRRRPREGLGRTLTASARRLRSTRPRRRSPPRARRPTTLSTPSAALGSTPRHPPRRRPPRRRPPAAGRTAKRRGSAHSQRRHQTTPPRMPRQRPPRGSSRPRPPPAAAPAPAPATYAPPAPAAAVSRFGGGDKCPRCHKTVYFAEAREGPNNVKYHRCVSRAAAAPVCVRPRGAAGAARLLARGFTRRAGGGACRPCFACAVCQRTLDSTFSERQGEVYCKSCYGEPRTALLRSATRGHPSLRPV